MWIMSSSIKNRVSNRARTNIFSRGSVSGWKASLLLLALASFSVVCAASGLPEGCDNLDTCFAKNSGELKEGQWKGIDINGDEITWDTRKSPGASTIDLYSKPCKNLSFNMTKPKDLDKGGNCEFSMHYHKCDMNIVWTSFKKVAYVLSFNGGEGGKASVAGSEVKVDLKGADLDCKSEGKFNRDPEGGDFCNFDPPKENGWCSFKFAFNKESGSCDGNIQFDKGYKLLAKPPTTAAPETTPTTDATTSVSIAAIDPNNANTTPGGDAAGLSPWIIAGIVVAVLLLVAVVVGLLVFFLIRRRKRRGSPQNMVEKGNVENDPQCVSALSHTNTTQVAATNMKSGSEMVGEPSANEHKEDEERSKPASKVEVVKPMSQKKKKDNTYQSLAVLQKEEAKNEPAPSPSPLPEENKPKRILTPDELYEPLGDPMKAIPMHLSEKKISEKKISSKKQKKKVEEEAKNTPATPSPSRSSKKKKSEKKKKDDHYHRLSSLENEAKK